MLAYVVAIRVKPGNIADFIAATAENQHHSRQEPGIAQFDLLQHGQASDQFILYEVYRSQADVAAHKQTAHYLKWKAAVEPWMAQPREGVQYALVGGQ